MKLSKKSFGLAAGILWGVAIFAVTNILSIRGSGGTIIIGLKNIYLGYRLSLLGSIIGFIWGFITGFIAGWLLAFLNNLFIKSSDKNF